MIVRQRQGLRLPPPSLPHLPSLSLPSVRGNDPFHPHPLTDKLALSRGPETRNRQARRSWGLSSSGTWRDRGLHWGRFALLHLCDGRTHKTVPLRSPAARLPVLRGTPRSSSGDNHQPPMGHKALVIRNEIAGKCG